MSNPQNKNLKRMLMKYMYTLETFLYMYRHARGFKRRNAGT